MLLAEHPQFRFNCLHKHLKHFFPSPLAPVYEPEGYFADWKLNLSGLHDSFEPVFSLTVIPPILPNLYATRKQDRLSPCNPHDRFFPFDL